MSAPLTRNGSGDSAFSYLKCLCAVFIALMGTAIWSMPDRLLLTFMGASRGYNACTGAVEMLGGILLFFPRTTLLGAPVSLATARNVCC